MKLKPSPYSLLFLLLIILGSCSSKSKIPVPADSAIVVHIDGASLHSKLSWEEFQKGQLYKLATEVADDFLKRVLSNPDSSGIDIKSDAYIFMKLQGKGGYSGFTVSLKDRKTFADFINHFLREEAKKEGDLSVIRHRDMVYTWNDDRVVIIGNSPELNNAGMSSSRSERNFPEDSLVKFASDVYSLKGKTSLGSNEKFSDLMSEKGDVHLWLNSGGLMGGSMPAALAITKASILFEGNFTTAVMNFDDGKITIDGKSHMNKELADLYKKYTSKNLDEEMLKKIPSTNVTGAIAMNYPPEGLKAFLALLGVDGLINTFLADMGYSIDDFIKANKGDLMLAVTDFGMVAPPADETGYTGRPKPNAKILFGTSINDKAAFDKLIGLLTQKLNEAPAGFGAMAAQIPHTIKGDYFLAGSDSALVHNYGTTSTPPSFISKISGHPMGLFIDIQKLIGGFRPSMGMDSASLAIADLSSTFWESIVFYGGEHKNDATESHFEINLVDKKTNSLKQLDNYLGTVAKVVKEQQEKQKARWEAQMDIPSAADSVAIPRAMEPQ